MITKIGNRLHEVRKRDILAPEKGDENRPYHPPVSRYIPVVVGTKLAFKFDPERGLIEWQHRGEKHVIDLADYQR